MCYFCVLFNSNKYSNNKASANQKKSEQNKTLVKTWKLEILRRKI